MRYLKDSYKTLDPYVVGELKEGIFLNANEAFYNTPKEIIDHLVEYVKNSNLNRYPDTDAKKLKKAIANKFDVLEENVTCGVGSDELLDIILRATSTNKFVLASIPTFSMYGIFTFMAEGNFETVDLLEDFNYDVDSLINKINETNPIITFICNPNNPTGSYMSKEDIIKVLNASKGLVIVDEAYEDFLNMSVVDLINEYDNLIVLRTFSKAYALAGIRCGYAISCKENIDMINMVKPPYTLNSFTIEAASFAISNSHLYDSLIKEVIENRNYLYNELVKLNIKCYKSYANFIYCILTDEQKSILENNKIFIRNFKNSSRITVGSKEENEALLKVLRGL